MRRLLLLLAVFGGVILLNLAGCYTQMGTTQDDRDRESEYSQSRRYDDTSSVQGEEPERSDYYSNNDYYDGGGYRPRIGFSYYYPSYYWPSTAFSVAYGNPWAYDCYWGYDPWICGTPYVVYPYYGYYPGAYSYPGYYSYYGYGSSYRRYHHADRSFGSARGSQGRTPSTETRFDVPSSGGTELPHAGRFAPSGSTPTRTSPSVKDNTRRTGTARGYYVPRSDGRGQGNANSVPRGSASRVGSSRAGARHYRLPDAPSRPATQDHGSPNNGAPAGNDGTPRVNNSPGVSPPRSAPPPAPSRGPSPASSGTSRSGRRP